MLRLVASDIDGTLVRADKSVSDRTRRALRQIQEAGVVVVVLVTARPTHTAELLARAIGVTGLILCSNGAVVYDLSRAEIVRHTPLAVDTARQLILALREALPDVCFAFIRGPRFACEPAYQRIADPADHADGFLASAILGDAIVLSEEAPTKLIARHPALDVDALLAHVRDLGLAGFEATHSGGSFVEVAAAGVTKAWALAALCAELGIGADEVVAFGDAPNDLPMLHWAGRGIAVANAHPTVLAAVGEIAPSNEDDGVAVVLEQLLAARPRPALCRQARRPARR
jgi:Cof subfamily protein (haloacid dehalogenase superfamily)